MNDDMNILDLPHDILQPLILSEPRLSKDVCRQTRSFILSEQKSSAIFYNNEAFVIGHLRESRSRLRELSLPFISFEIWQTIALYCPYIESLSYPVLVKPFDEASMPTPLLLPSLTKITIGSLRYVPWFVRFSPSLSELTFESAVLPEFLVESFSCISSQLRSIVFSVDDSVSASDIDQTILFLSQCPSLTDVLFPRVSDFLKDVRPHYVTMLRAIIQRLDVFPSDIAPIGWLLECSRKKQYRKIRLWEIPPFLPQCNLAPDCVVEGLLSCDSEEEARMLTSITNCYEGAFCVESRWKAAAIRPQRSTQGTFHLAVPTFDPLMSVIASYARETLTKLTLSGDSCFTLNESHLGVLCTIPQLQILSLYFVSLCFPRPITQFTFPKVTHLTFCRSNDPDLPIASGEECRYMLCAFPYVEVLEFHGVSMLLNAPFQYLRSFDFEIVSQSEFEKGIQKLQQKTTLCSLIVSPAATGRMLKSSQILPSLAQMSWLVSLRLSCVYVKDSVLQDFLIQVPNLHSLLLETSCHISRGCCAVVAQYGTKLRELWFHVNNSTSHEDAFLIPVALQHFSLRLMRLGHEWPLTAPPEFVGPVQLSYFFFYAQGYTREEEDE